MISVHLRDEPEPVLAIPTSDAGTVVLSIILGDDNALGVGTRINDVAMPHSDNPMGCWIWGKWGTKPLERYRCPTREFDAWVPLSVNLGIGDALDTRGTIGPEIELGPRRLEQLRPHAEDKSKLAHGTVKFAAAGSTASTNMSPRLTWSPPLAANEDSDDPTEQARIDATCSIHSNAAMLMSQYIEPAIEELELEGKTVLIDAMYVSLGTHDCCALDHLDGAHRALPAHLEFLRSWVGEGIGVPDLPMVVSMPLFNSSHAPLERTEIARHKLEEMFEDAEDVHLVKVDDLSRQADGTHLTGRAQLGQAMRWAAVWDTQVTRLYQPTTRVTVG